MHLKSLVLMAYSFCKTNSHELPFTMPADVSLYEYERYITKMVDLGISYYDDVNSDFRR